MALVFIQVQDKADGTVDVRVSAEPHTAELAELGVEMFTPAQHLGAVALNAIQAELQTQPTRPQLVVAGADEMPLYPVPPSGAGLFGVG